MNYVEKLHESHKGHKVVQALSLSIVDYYIFNNTTKSTKNFAARVAMGGFRKYDHICPIIKNYNG